jgi:hypothetical protein
MKTKIFYERCSITTNGTRIRCPLCETIVESGQSHYCEKKKPVIRKPRRGK